MSFPLQPNTEPKSTGVALRDVSWTMRPVVEFLLTFARHRTSESGQVLVRAVLC